MYWDTIPNVNDHFCEGNSAGTSFASQAILWKVAKTFPRLAPQWATQTPMASVGWTATRKRRHIAHWLSSLCLVWRKLIFNGFKMRF